VLDALYHLGPRSQKDLGSHILKSGGNMTMVVDNLEKNDLVRRERSQEDRRFIQVHITEKGKKLFGKILPGIVTFIEEDMSALTSPELEELGRLCVKIVHRMGGDKK
jgi:MarR family 2-MHQ and catechol resistance regulon transcriptional repressor